MKANEIQMMNNRVLIRLKEMDRYEGDSKIIIPDEYKLNSRRGFVVACGPGKMLNGQVDRETVVSPGDEVYLYEYAGSEVEIEGEKYIMAPDEDISGVFHGERSIDLFPLWDLILIEWEEAQPEFKGTKILRGGNLNTRHYTGNVLKFGPGCYYVAEGDRIFFDQFCGPGKIVYNGKRYALIHEYDIYCTLPPRETINVLSE